MAAMATDIDTRSLYLSNTAPALYISLPADAHPDVVTFLIQTALQFGLYPFDPDGDVAQADDGWQVVFDRQGPGDPAPHMSVWWPPFPPPLLHGVRKTSPTGWADDAAGAGHILLIIGPALDWSAMVAVPDPDHGSIGIVMWEAIAEGIGGRAAAAGIVPAEARQP